MARNFRATTILEDDHWKTFCEKFQVVFNYQTHNRSLYVLLFICMELVFKIESMVVDTTATILYRMQL